MRYPLPWHRLPMPVAVVDLETTGMSTDTDRIVEIAVLRLEADRPPRWLDSRVNPLRDPGPTHVHGLSSRDLRDAPVFADLAPALRPLLEGAVMVAHNASFEQRFLSAEFEAIGARWGLPRLCTVKLSRSLFPERRGPGSNTLGTLTDHYGIVNKHAHRAMGDVLATAELLGALLTDDAAPVSVSSALSSAWWSSEHDPVWPGGEAARPFPRHPRLGPPSAAPTPPSRAWSEVSVARRRNLANALKLSELLALTSALQLGVHTTRPTATRALVQGYSGPAQAVFDRLEQATRDRVADWLGVPALKSFLAA